MVSGDATFVGGAAAAGSGLVLFEVALNTGAEGSPNVSPARLAHFKNDRRFIYVPCSMAFLSDLCEYHCALCGQKLRRRHRTDSTEQEFLSRSSKERKQKQHAEQNIDSAKYEV